MEGADRDRFAKLCTFPALIPVEKSLVLAEPVLGFEDPPENRRAVLKARALPLLPSLRGLPLRFLTPRQAGQPVAVGSSSAADVKIDALGVSGFHAELVRRKGRWSLSDMESTNGTFVEGRRLPVGIPIPLGGGQYVRFGTAVHLFLTPEEVFELILRCRGEDRERSSIPPGGRQLEELLEEDVDLEGPPFLLQVPVEGEFDPSEAELTNQLSDSVILGRKKGQGSPQLRVHVLLARPGAGPELVIGRRHDCDLLIPDSSVSKQHARARLKDRGWQIMDLESANGTFLGGNRLPVGVWTRVSVGTTVSIGAYRALFLSAEQFTQLLGQLAKKTARRQK